jgi:hypothetical protein
MRESVQEAESEGCQYLYVYGIVPLKNNTKTVKFEFAGLLGLGGKPVTIVPYRDVAAVVTSYPVLKPLVNETEAMLHAEVLKKIGCEDECDTYGVWELIHGLTKVKKVF